jgi:flagellar biogenesis protein FliO
MSSNPLLFCSSATKNMGARVRSLFAGFNVRRASRQLRLCESLSLGEKRLVAVVQYENQKFLVGGGPQSVNLLARLGGEDNVPWERTEWRES